VKSDSLRGVLANMAQRRMLARFVIDEVCNMLHNRHDAATIAFCLHAW
jgi:hypothetical protein